MKPGASRRRLISIAALIIIPLLLASVHLPTYLTWRREWDLLGRIEDKICNAAYSKHGEESLIRYVSTYLADLVAQRRAEPKDDLLSVLIEATEDGDRLTEEELIANTLLIYAAGFETTTNLIGNMVLTLLRHPDQLAMLRADRSLVPSAVEEVLRFQPPVQVDGRFVMQDLEIAGHQLHKGDNVITLVATANRDRAVFDDPDTFDITRDSSQILSFGYGIHYCLGASLARLEGQVVLERLLDRFSAWRLVEEPTWRPRIVLRGVEHLEVELS